MYGQGEGQVDCIGKGSSRPSREAIYDSNKVEDRARVGGSAIVLNSYWGTRAYDWFQDESELGLVMGVYLKLPSTKAL